MNRICLGQILGPHGVRGLVKVRSFTEIPEALTAYGPLTDSTGARQFELTLQSPLKGAWIARIAGVQDRTVAETLKGVKLYVAREALPEPENEDEFYLADLVGLRAETRDGGWFGTVRSVQNYGAGDVLEITLGDSRETVLLPFTRTVVPVISLPTGRLVVDPPEGLLDPPDPWQEGEAAAEPLADSDRTDGTATDSIDEATTDSGGRDHGPSAQTGEPER